MTRELELANIQAIIDVAKYIVAHPAKILDGPCSMQGRSEGGIWVFIPPKSAQVNSLWGKNDVRTAIQQVYTPQKTFIPPKQISGYAPGAMDHPAAPLWHRPIQN